MTTSKKLKYLSRNAPYKDFPSVLIRPRENMCKPKDRNERLYCWYYWLMIAQANPRWLLDNLNNLTSYKSDWSANERSKISYKYRSSYKRRAKYATTTK